VSPAQEILAARRRRTVRIRTYVAVGLVVTFAAFFGVIYVRMALGKDPGLRTTASRRTAVRQTPGGAPPASPSGSGEYPGYGGGPGGGFGAPGGGPSPGSNAPSGVTTHSS
jgi:hypothetical protein